MKCKGRKQFVPTTFTQMSIRAAGAALADHFILYQADAELVNAKVLGTDIVLIGTLGARPAAGVAGRLYLSNDNTSPGGKIFRDNGATWDEWKPTDAAQLVIKNTADQVTLVVRPFQDGANANDIFQVTNAGYTLSWIRVLKDGSVQITQSILSIAQMVGQALQDAVTAILKPFSDVQVNDIFQVTNAGYSKSHLAVGANGKVRTETGWKNAAGFQHVRTATPNLAAGASASVTVNWNPAFADTNYTVALSIFSTGEHSATITAKTAGSLTVLIVNHGSGADGAGELGTIAFHD